MCSHAAIGLQRSSWACLMGRRLTSGAWAVYWLSWLRAMCSSRLVALLVVTVHVFLPVWSLWALGIVSRSVKPDCPCTNIRSAWWAQGYISMGCMHTTARDLRCFAAAASACSDNLRRMTRSQRCWHVWRAFWARCQAGWWRRGATATATTHAAGSSTSAAKSAPGMDPDLTLSGCVV